MSHNIWVCLRCKLTCHSLRPMGPHNVKHGGDWSQTVDIGPCIVSESRWQTCKRNHLIPSTVKELEKARTVKLEVSG